MSELKFEDIQVGDTFEDTIVEEFGVVYRVDVGEKAAIHIHWNDTGAACYWPDEINELLEFNYTPTTDVVADPVTAPPHYNLPNGLQVIDLTKNESFLRGNVLKYVFRAPHKGNELEDLLKARQYLNWEIERVEKESK